MAEKKIEFADSMDLPIAVATQPCAVMAKRGAGKTYTSKKIVEGLYGSGVQVIVIDPVGVWSGLRLDKDGESPGLSIPILGGLKADLPLSEDSGHVVAKLAAEEKLSMVLDVSSMRKAARQRFVGLFAEELLHQKKKNKSPLFIVIEEAQLFVPQRAIKGAERMLGAIEDLCRLGRNFGIGYLLISQRPQSVHKEVLNQAEVLIVGQISGAHERKAIEQWLVYQGLDSKKLADSLTSLGTGKESEGYLWSPSWLRKFEKIRVLPINTFDSSATPEFDEKIADGSARMAEVDVASLTAALESKIQQEEDNDPRLLKKRIAELERDLRSAVTEVKKEVEVVREVEVRVEPPEGLSQALDEAEKSLGVFLESLNLVNKIASSAPAKVVTKQDGKTPAGSSSKKPSRVNRTTIKSNPAPRGANSIDLPKAQRAVLEAIVQSGGEATGSKASIVSGYSYRSSTMRNACSGLRQAGLIEGSLTDTLRATPEGFSAVPDVEPLPTGQELQQHWISKLGGAPQAILIAFIDNWPKEVDVDQLEQETGYSSNSSTVRNALSKLRKLGLIEGGRGVHKAHDDLFV